MNFSEYVFTPLQTLTADVPRITDLQWNAETVALRASTLLVVWNVIGSAVADSAFKGDLAELIGACIENRNSPADRALMESVVAWIAPEVQGHLAEGTDSASILANLKDQIIDLHRRDHPVRLLISMYFSAHFSSLFFLILPYSSFLCISLVFLHYSSLFFVFKFFYFFHWIDWRKVQL